MSGAGRTRGQSTVELALVISLVAIALLVAIQVGLVVITKLGVTHTAREVARVLAVDPSADPERIADAVPGSGQDRTVTVRWKPAPVAEGRLVEVRVEARVPALGGPWAPAVRVAATAVMFVEM